MCESLHFFKGISKRAYTDDELRKMKEHTVKYNGKEYTDYKASQIQRRMEREIRATKREILALDKARNSVGISQELKDSLNSDYNMASVVLARKNEQLADFLEQTGRGEDRARMLVDGFDRSRAQASVWAARKSLSKTVDILKDRGIMEMNRLETVVINVQTVGKIDIKKYACITEDIKTDEVIITNRQIEHIKERHPKDYERYNRYFAEIVENPDYIIEANKPNTALLLKKIKEDGVEFKTVLRLATSNDSEEIKNSIITFMKIDEKEWKRILRNKKILYKSE